MKHEATLLANHFSLIHAGIVSSLCGMSPFKNTFFIAPVEFLIWNFCPLLLQILPENIERFLSWVSNDPTLVAEVHDHKRTLR